MHVVMLMQLVPEDQAKGLKTPVWEEYKSIVNQVQLLPGLHTHCNGRLCDLQHQHAYHYSYFVHVLCAKLCRLREKRLVWS